jgi:hypothetical protein
MGGELRGCSGLISEDAFSVKEQQFLISYKTGNSKK